MVDEIERDGESASDDRRQHDRSRLIVDVFFDGRMQPASPLPKTSASAAST